MHHDTNNFLSVERCWVRGHSSFNLFKDVSGKYSLILTLGSQGHRARFTGTQGSVHSHPLHFTVQQLLPQVRVWVVQGMEQ